MLFSYLARTKEGKMQKGAVEASNRQKALEILEKYGLYATSLKIAKSRGLLGRALIIGREVSRKDLVMFTRQLGTMLKSAIPPLDALRSLVVQAENSRFRSKILKMAEALEKGSTLNQALSLEQKVFDSFYRSIIKSGEASGRLADSLNYLADHLERDYNFRQKVKGALFYPMFVVAVFMGSFSVVVFFIVPRLTEILKTFNPEDLPILTKGLIAVGTFIGKGGWIAVLVLLIPLAALAVLILKSKKARHFYHKASLKLPLLGDFYKKIQLSNFGENFAVLISSGLPITQALDITYDIISNTVYKKIILEAKEGVSQGERISDIIARYPKQFPAFVVQMVLTGEKTGNLQKTLMDMVVFYRGEIERTTEKLTTMLEPILILVLGIGIAILAFAVFIPLFKIGIGGFS